MKRNISVAFLLMIGFISCKPATWNQADRQAFFGGCLKKSVPEMGEEKARTYCSCMLKKVEGRYPDPSKAAYMKQDTAMYRLGRSCLPQ